MNQNRIVIWTGLALSVAVLGAWLWIWSAWRAFERSIAAAEAEVRATPPSSSPPADLPPALRRFAERSGLPSPEKLRWIRVEQEGEMRLKPGGEWIPFRGAETFAIPRTAFVWRAEMRMFGLPVLVTDSFDGRDGRLEARLLGALPLAQDRGPQVSQGEMLRYLAEVIWIPAALLANPELSWEQLDERKLRGTAEVAGIRVEAGFELDEAGDIVRISVRERPRSGSDAPAPWGAEAGDYRLVDGLRLATRAVVYWDLPEGRFDYWRGTITRASWE
jgi:hypothetical protein